MAKSSDGWLSIDHNMEQKPVFNSQKWEIIIKLARFLYLVSSMYVVEDIEGWLKICILYLIYSQISLNLPKDDRQFCQVGGLAVRLQEDWAKPGYRGQARK